MDAYPQELALFEPTVRDVALQKVQYVEYRPTSQLNNGPLQFFIPATANQYIDLKRSQLFVRIRIIKGDGNKPSETDHVAPSNLPLHTLFNQVDL